MVNCRQNTFSLLNCSTRADEERAVSTLVAGVSRGATKTTTSWLPSLNSTPVSTRAAKPSTLIRVALAKGGLSERAVNRYEPDNPVIRNEPFDATVAAMALDAAYCSLAGDAITCRPTD